MIFASPIAYIPPMRVLCVARHEFLSEHLGRYFDAFGVETTSCVGLAQAGELVAALDIDAVFCDYDLLLSIQPDAWSSNPVVSRLPVVAVSLTRDAGEAHFVNSQGITAFLYLAKLQSEDVHRVLESVRRQMGVTIPPNPLPWQ